MRFLGFLSLIIAYLLASCSAGANIQTDSSGQIVTPEQSIIVESTSLPSQEPLETSTTVSTSEISESKNEILGIEPHGVELAFWNKDTEMIYALNPGPTLRIEWFSYDLVEDKKNQIEPPISYERDSWYGLGLPQYLEEDYWKFAEVDGLVSPSGDRFVYLREGAQGNEVWIKGPEGNWKIDFRNTFIGTIGKAAWLDNETNVLITLASAGPPDVFIVDINENSAKKIQEATAFAGLSIEKWALSPNGQLLAAIDIGGELHIVNLVEGKDTVLDTTAAELSWSPSGDKLYYWQRELFAMPGDIEDANLIGYDIQTGEYSRILSQEELSNLNPDRDLAFGNFVVSDSGKQIAFYSGWLQIVTLD